RPRIASPGSRPDRVPTRSRSRPSARSRATPACSAWTSSSRRPRETSRDPDERSLREVPAIVAHAQGEDALVEAAHDGQETHGGEGVSGRALGLDEIDLDL